MAINLDKESGFIANYYLLLSKLQHIGSFLAFSMGIVFTVKAQIDLDKQRELTGLLEKVSDNAISIYIVAGILFIAGIAFTKMMEPWRVKNLKFILDTYQEKVFDKREGESEDENRVTLFKYKKRCWLCFLERKGLPLPFRKHGYLVPFMRSGCQSQLSSAVFLVPNSSRHTEGIAGRAYSTNRQVSIDNLANINSSTSVRNLKKYAEDSFMGENMVRRYANENKTLPRSITAIPIEVNNKRWGVLVLDSVHPTGISSDAISNYTVTLALIGRLLEG